MDDLRPQHNEEAVGANHPLKTDVINRAFNVEHDIDGTHKGRDWSFWGLPNVRLIDYYSGDVTKVKVNPSAYNIPLLIGAIWHVMTAAVDVDIDTDIDIGAKAVGSDYYVYACTDGATLSFKISLNSTNPTGFDAAHSRKLGGFHYGRVRNSITTSDVTSGAIVPNSIWDLKFRPACSPEGMAYIGNGVWCDIYLPSVNAAITFSNGNGSPITTGTAKSTYNSTPLTGTEGLSAYSFNELARQSGKRLLTLSEWLQAAHGSPPGEDGNNDHAWAKTTNGARAATGSVADAISLLNIVDCVGNVLEWVDEYLQNGIEAAGAWVDEMPGLNVGRLYVYGNDSFRQIVAGGNWASGLLAGSRCVALCNCPWVVHTSFSSRFACDAL
jgi:hypothetical protein